MDSSAKAVLDFLCAMLCRSFSFVFTHFEHSLPDFIRPEIRCLGFPLRSAQPTFLYTITVILRL